MKQILLLAGVLILLTTSGCIVADGDRGGHARRYERHDEVIIGPPVLVLRPPEIIVR